MARFRIVGGKKLSGVAKISGSKNEALKLIPLSVVINNKLLVSNVPRIKDISSMLEIFESIGGKYKFYGNTLSLDGRAVNKTRIPTKLAGKLRSSIVFLGPLLARFGEVSCPHPGGCVIGSRSINTHTDAFRQLGAILTIDDCRFNLKINKNSGGTVVLKEKSVTATENIILYACSLDSKIVLKNCAIEPEIIHLLKTIRRGGARVRGIGSRFVTIEGKEFLKIKNIEVIPDRIEAGTFAIALIATGGSGKVTPFPKNDLAPLVNLLKKSGAKISFKGKDLIVKESHKISPFSISTSPHPGFPTDLQSPMSLIAAIAKGKSKISENLFENRLVYLLELEKMGLSVTIDGPHKATITGPVKFQAKTIDSLDLRSGITLLIAGIMAQGETVINKAEIIDRGYENVEKKFIRLGAKIYRET